MGFGRVLGSHEVMGWCPHNGISTLIRRDAREFCLSPSLFSLSPFAHSPRRRQSASQEGGSHQNATTLSMPIMISQPPEQRKFLLVCGILLCKPEKTKTTPNTTAFSYIITPGKIGITP